MKKGTKHIITITVYVLIIIYFLVFHSSGIGGNKICKNFDNVLSSRIEQYFVNPLSESNGETLSVDVRELIAYGYLTLTDLQDVGTSCYGSAYASKVDGKYYYYNDITCGSCSSDSIYAAWSDWSETLPDFGGKKHQVMTKTLYNYSNSDKKYSDWSDWGESIDSIKAPTIPNNASPVDNDVESKSKYTYRDAEYQWYKLDSKVEYYGNGAYYESSPANGYMKDDSTKTISRQSKLYRTKAALKQSEPSFPDSSISQVNGYAQKVAKYIYSYEKLGDAVTSMYFADNAASAVSKCQVDGYVNCKAISTTETQYTKKEYKCSPSAYGWKTTSNSTVSSCEETPSNCSSSSDVGNQRVTCQTTAWIPTTSTCQSTYAYTNQTSGTAWIKKDGSCNNSEDICKNLTSGLRTALKNEQWCVDYSPSCSSSSDVGNQKLTSCSVSRSYCTKSTGAHSCMDDWVPCTDPMKLSSNCTSCYVFISSPTKGALCKYLSKTYGTMSRLLYTLSYQTCQGVYANVETTGSEVTSCTTVSTPTCSSATLGTSAVTKCTPSKYNKTVETCGANGYTRSSSPTSTTVVSTCTPSQSQSCTSSSPVITCTESKKIVYGYSGNRASTIYYLKSDGTTTTNKSQASYLTDSEYNALKSKNSSLSNYKKTGTAIYDSSNSPLIEGNCPNGNYECLVLYKATVYKYKWYRNTEASKTWCNDKKYSSASPEKGCIKDESSAKWGEWSSYQDTKPTESDSREIKAIQLMRYRIIYTNTDSVVLDEWLPLSEFEDVVGKTVEELRKQENITVWEKTMYKYRILK